MVSEVENGKNKANGARMVVIWLNGGSNMLGSLCMDKKVPDHISILGYNKMTKSISSESPF